jgi:hypothetical protein
LLLKQFSLLMSQRQAALVLLMQLPVRLLLLLRGLLAR